MSAASAAPSATDRFRDDVVLRARSWAWLIALRQRLRAAVQLVDGQLEPVLPPGDAPADVSLAAIVAAKPALLREAVTRAQETRAPQAVVIEPLLISCLALVAEGRVVGALLVARDGADAKLAPPKRSELEALGATLVNVVEAHVAEAASTDAEEIDRIRALARLFSDAAAVQKERDLVAAFAEAMAIWHDLELRGYLDTGRQDFLLEVSLPGADLSRAPSRLTADAVPEGTGPLVLPGEVADTLGLPAGAEAMAARLGAGRGAWLLILSGQFDTHTRARVDVYLDLLAQWIARRAAESVLRMSRAVADALLRGGGAPEAAAARALDALQQELPGTVARIRITGPTSAVRIDVGEWAVDPADELVVLRRGADRGCVTLTLAASGGRFTARDGAVAELAADLFDAWSRQAIRAGGGDRRQAARVTDEILDRFAAAALDRGLEVSAIVLDTPATAVVPGLAQRWLAEIRRTLRVSDLAGVLGDGAVGVLLHETPPARAAAVAARLRDVLEAGDRSVEPISIGIAGRAPGGEWSRPIIDDARAHAAPVLPSSSSTVSADPDRLL